jgi:hypothetical protein
MGDKISRRNRSKNLGFKKIVARRRFRENFTKIKD